MSTPYLTLKEVSIGYSHPLITPIEASISKGEIVLLIGGNGVGKTTLMRSILGQVPLISGNVWLNGEAINSLSPSQRARHTAVVLSKTNVPSHLSVMDLVSLGKYIYYPYYIKLSKAHEIEVQKTIENLGLKPYQNHLLSQLSEGNLQKAYIARALCQDAPFILLDEPTAHLDEQNKIMILKLLRDLAKTYGKLILFSSHDFRLAKEFADQIWLIKEGKFYSGISEDVLSNHQELLQPLLFDLNQGFVPPTIHAAPYEKELLYSFLQKHFQFDFSNYHFTDQNGNWHLENNQISRVFHSYAELKKFLSNLN